MVKLFNRLNKVFQDVKEKENFSRVIAPSFIIHFFAAILSVALWLTLTRTLGSKQYGIYTYSFSIIYLLVNLATYGLNLLMVREIPALLSQGKQGLAKGFYNWSARIVLILCITVPIAVAAFIAVSIYGLHVVKESVYTLPLLLASTAIPFSALMNFYSSSLRGRHKPVVSLLPDNIIKPVSFLLCVFILIGFSGALSLQNAIFLTTFSLIVASIYTFRANRKETGSVATEAEYDTKLWRKSLRSVFLLTLLLNINPRVDIIMLRLLRSSSELGIYSIADGIASKLPIFLTVMNLISAASIARLYSLKETRKLQKLITKISRWVMLASIPAFLIMIIFSHWILAWFGPGFVQGQTAMIIICAGQLISIAFGPAGNLSVMTGNEKYFIWFSVIRLVLNVILNLLLTPSLGINGTAIATTVCIIVGNTGMFLSIKKKTGISTWILG